MVYTPFDFNEAIAHRKDYVEDGLREGSPVVGLSFPDGIILLTVRRTQRKVFEIYDRLAYSAIGRQSDIEDIRLGAIKVAHEEGYGRSPDDVTAHRLVGFALSPTLKKLFGDQFNAPAVVRALFAELGARPQDDLFYVLNYDGDYSQTGERAVIAGTPEAEERMLAALSAGAPPATRDDAIRLALEAWGHGALESRRLPADEKEVDDEARARQVEALIAQELKAGALEVGLLDRTTPNEAKFRLLDPAELPTRG
jgi:proteasome alpha subunit